jgi:hypothetical protein
LSTLHSFEKQNQEQEILKAINKRIVLYRLQTLQALRQRKYYDCTTKQWDNFRKYLEAYPHYAIINKFSPSKQLPLKIINYNTYRYGISLKSIFILSYSSFHTLLFTVIFSEF